MKLKKIILISVFLLLAIPHLAIASEEKQSIPDFVTKSLDTLFDSVNDRDSTAMLNLSEDIRFVDDEVSRAEFYEKDMLERSEKIESYTVTSLASNSESEYVLTVEILFDTGEKVSVPFGLKIKEGVWKVVMGYDIQNPESDQSLSVDRPLESLSPTASTQLCNWNFWDRNYSTTFKSSCSFDVNSSSKYLHLNLQQYQSDNYTNNNFSITYAVVQESWLGDTVWGSTTVSGSKTSATGANLYGNSTTFNGAKIRFTISGVYGETYDGFGEVYQN